MGILRLGFRCGGMDRVEISANSSIKYGDTMSTRCHAAAIFLLALVSFGAQAQTTVPTTGLGTCIDFITSQSTTLTGQINSSTTFKIAYGSASYTDMPNKVVYIRNYSCAI